MTNVNIVNAMLILGLLAPGEGTDAEGQIHEIGIQWGQTLPDKTLELTALLNIANPRFWDPRCQRCFGSDFYVSHSKVNFSTSMCTTASPETCRVHELKRPGSQEHHEITRTAWG